MSEHHQPPAGDTNITLAGDINTTAPVDENPSLWRNRRRMAYISIISIIFFMLLSFAGILPYVGLGDIPIDKFRIFVDLVQVYLVTASSIIAAYIGFATWSYTKGK